MSKTFAVIGDPIDHSLSPNIHSAAFRELNLDCSYIAYRIPKGELQEGIEAVNTVSNDNGVLKGYNTDMDGFLEPFKKRNISIKNLKVLLLGAGGAARAIVCGLAKEHVQNITIANRTIENAKRLVEFSNKIGVNSNAIKINEIGESAKNYDIIINATSIGLKNELSPISLDSVNSKTIVYDIVYMPINTDFLKKAKEKKAIIIYGYEMLLGQATRAFEIWHGIEAPYNAMKKALLGGT